MGSNIMKQTKTVKVMVNNKYNYALRAIVYCFCSDNGRVGSDLGKTVELKNVRTTFSVLLSGRVLSQSTVL